MKKIIFASIFLILSAFFAIFLSKITSSEKTLNRESLNIISEYNDYLLTVEKGKEIDNYYVYEYKDSRYFRKFALPLGHVIESNLVVWHENNLYILDFYPSSYNLLSGEKMNEGNLSEMTNNSNSVIENIIGIYDNYIYYEYSHYSSHCYGKVDLNLSNSKLVDEDEIIMVKKALSI